MRYNYEIYACQRVSKQNNYETYALFVLQFHHDTIANLDNQQSW